jgi:hypothetical protein
MSYIEANKNTEQRTVIQMYCLQHAQANKSCDYDDDFYRAEIDYEMLREKFPTSHVDCLIKKPFQIQDLVKRVRAELG